MLAPWLLTNPLPLSLWCLSRPRAQSSPVSVLSLIPKKLCGGTVFGIAKSGHPLFVPRECPLAAHHVSAEVGQLQPQGCEHGVAATAGVGGDGHGAAIEQGPKVIALHRQPGDGAGEHRRDRTVVLRRADHPARTCGLLGPACGDHQQITGRRWRWRHRVAQTQNAHHGRS